MPGPWKAPERSGGPAVASDRCNWLLAAGSLEASHSLWAYSWRGTTGCLEMVSGEKGGRSHGGSLVHSEPVQVDFPRGGRPVPGAGPRGGMPVRSCSREALLAAGGHCARPSSAASVPNPPLVYNDRDVGRDTAGLLLNLSPSTLAEGDFSTADPHVSLGGLARISRFGRPRWYAGIRRTGAVLAGHPRRALLAVGP